MEARFRKYVSTTPTETGCLLWTGYSYQATPNYRRPSFSIATSKSDIASRVAYKLFKGEILPGQVVRHTCDNPMCVNTDHLVLGTQQDNIRDMVARGRGCVPRPMSQGEKHHQAKLTEERVREIRVSAEPYGILAERFGVSVGAIKAVRQGKTWKHTLALQQ